MRVMCLREENRGWRSWRGEPEAEIPAVKGRGRNKDRTPAEEKKEAIPLVDHLPAQARRAFVT